MPDPFPTVLTPLRLRERLGDVHHDLLEAMLAHDALLTPRQRRRWYRVLGWVQRAHDAVVGLEEEASHENATD